MLGHIVARKPAPLLAWRPIGLRLRLGPTALGNAVGSSLAYSENSPLPQGAGTNASPYVDPDTGEHIVFAAPSPSPSYPDLSPYIQSGRPDGQGGVQIAKSDPNWGSYVQLASATNDSPFTVQISGVGWTRSTAVPRLDDGTDVYQSTNPNDHRLQVEVPSNALVPNVPGYDMVGSESYPKLRTNSYYYLPTPPVAPITVTPDDFAPLQPLTFDFTPIDVQVAAGPAIAVGPSPAVADAGNVWQPTVVGGSIGLGLPDHSVGTPVPANPRLPVNNGSWTNPSRPGNSGWQSTDPRVNAVTGGKPVQFRNGVVDFSPWSQGRIPVPGMTGNSTNDLRLGRDILRDQLNLPSDAAVQRWLKSQGVTLHHDVNGVTLDKIPSPLHNNVTHTGGASILRNWDYSQGSPADFFNANRIATGARYLGVAGMTVGAVVDGGSLLTQYQISKQTGNYSNLTAEGLRVAGGWGGAWAVGAAGSEFGAGFGSVFGPVGFVVGGVIGGIVGGALGYAGGSYAMPGLASDIGLLPGQGG